MGTTDGRTSLLGSGHPTRPDPPRMVTHSFRPTRPDVHTDPSPVGFPQGLHTLSRDEFIRSLRKYLLKRSPGAPLGAED